MSYIGQNLPTDVFGGYTTDTFAGDGSATTFTLSQAPFNEQGLIVVINNVIQHPTTNYPVSGTTLTIVGTAVASGDVIYATHIGGALPIGQAASLDLNGASDQLILDADADTTISADTDDQIDFKVGGSDVFHILGSKLIVADTASHTDDFLQIESPASGGGHGIQIRRNDTNTDQTVGRVQFGNNSDVDLGIVACKTDGANNTGAIVVSTASAGTTAERFRVTEAGIHIGGTADANALDDYEEGTWTPANANVTLSVTSAIYRKVGSIVYVSAYVTYPSNSEGNSAQITGFPFAGGASNVFGYLTGRCANQASQVVIQVNAGVTNADIYKEDDTGLSNSAMNGYFIFSGTYVTSA